MHTVRDGAMHGLARNGFGGYFTDHAGLVRDQGKKRIEPRDSDVFAWKPSRRSLAQPGHEHHEKPEGTRIVEQPQRKVYSVRERRHIRQVESKEEIGDFPSGKNIVYRDNGLRAHDQPAREVDLIHEISRKNRPLDLISQRNGIHCRSLGDKPYRHPEYESGFHAAGEMIIGSSFARGSFKKTEARNATSVQLVIDPNKPPVKSYEEKLRERQAMEARGEVAELTRTWEADTLKDCEEAAYVDMDSDDEVGEPQAA
mmetsp:Transcript_35660/g.91686  ORF Transcript_35660/g.91686 Transcript_35660/m.91686 type:complete len:256 (-) Transcript_35660:87-854(-)